MMYFVIGLAVGILGTLLVMGGILKKETASLKRQLDFAVSQIHVYIDRFYNEKDHSETLQNELFIAANPRIVDPSPASA